MRASGRVSVLLAVSCTMSVSCLILYAHSSDEGGKTENTWGAEEQKGLAEKTDIFFLKTHKCASSTVQNILMRFGYRRHLDFVLPLKANYLGHPAPFDRDMIPQQLNSLNQTYNIFTHHSRYNYEEVKAVMKENATFVTILRDPANLFESMYQFYHLELITNMTLQKFIKTPKMWDYLAARSPARKIGTNQMSFDLGLNVAGFVDGKKNDFLDDFIRRIEMEFDLVMITEYMEASLVFLSKLMNWPLERVASFKVNSRQSMKKIQLSTPEHDTLMNANFIDARIYNYFLKKFQDRIADFGVEEMKVEVRKLLDLNSKLWTTCVDKTNVKGYGRTLSYDLRNPQDFECFYSAKDELSFTEEIRNDQIKRFSTLRKLDSLMSDYMEA